MIWWTADTATGQLADLIRLTAPATPLEVRYGWEPDLRNMLATTQLGYPNGEHTRHAGPADRAFADIAVVPVVTALIAAELDANEACTLGRIHQRLVIGRGAQRVDLDAGHIEIRARKLVIDAAAELLCSTRLCHPDLTDGGRYEIRSDIRHGVDLVMRFRHAGPRCLQIKRGANTGPSVPGQCLVVSMYRREEGEFIGPGFVATWDHIRRFVELSDITSDSGAGQMTMEF